MRSALLAALAFSSAVALPASVPPSTRLVSADATGNAGLDQSIHPSISADGRRVAFESQATLAAADTNDTWDVYVRDLSEGTTLLTSISSTGEPASHPSFFGSVAPDMSADGRYVAFESTASNLVDEDTNDAADVFVRDLGAGTTERVSVSSAGEQANALSRLPSISADGRYVAFQSGASNLVAGDTNSSTDVFVRDRAASLTVRVSVTSAGDQGFEALAPSISGDGRYVAFESDDDNLAPPDTNESKDIVVHDRDVDADGEYDEPGFVRTSRVSVPLDEVAVPSFDPVVSAGGTLVAFTSAHPRLVEGDGNGRPDVFVAELSTGELGRASVDSFGLQGDGQSVAPAISGDARYVAFASLAGNLAPRDANGTWDLFVRDLRLGTTARVSIGDEGAEGDGASLDPSISSDGRYVAFQSEAGNFHPGTPDFIQVFRRDRGACAGGRPPSGEASGRLRDLGAGETHVAACLLASAGL